MSEELERQQLVEEIHSHFKNLPVELIHASLISFKIKQLKDAAEFLNGRKKKRNISRIIRRIEALSGEANAARQ